MFAVDTRMQKPAFNDISKTIQEFKKSGEQFVLATVVRTVSVTAAKPGAKAIINANGDIVDGWIGGGCARAAVIKAALKSFEDGEPVLVSLKPEDLLREQELKTGVRQDGVVQASNLCPSKGSMDIFVEPFLADPELLIFGSSPVASVLASLADFFAFNISIASSEQSTDTYDSVANSTPYDQLIPHHSKRYVVVATQGSGDIAALKKALEVESKYIGFVGSPRKTKHLKEKLLSQGTPDQQLDRIKGPAGINIGGLTPQEIALSILAEIIELHRSDFRSLEATDI